MLNAAAVLSAGESTCRSGFLSEGAIGRQGVVVRNVPNS